MQLPLSHTDSQHLRQGDYDMKPKDAGNGMDKGQITPCRRSSNAERAAFAPSPIAMTICL